MMIQSILRKHLDDFIAFRDAVLQVLAKYMAGDLPGAGNSACATAVPTFMAQRAKLTNG